MMPASPRRQTRHGLFSLVRKDTVEMDHDRSLQLPLSCAVVNTADEDSPGTTGQ